MKKIKEVLTIFLISFFILPNFLFFIACSNNFQETSQKEGIHVLFLMPRSIGANNFLVRDVFEEHGWQVTRTAVADASMPCAFWGRYAEALPIIPEMNISKIKNITDYDCLFISTAPGNAWKVPNSYQDLLESPEALDLISTATRNEMPVFAMCAGVRVLAAADVIRGKTVVGSPRFQNEYQAAGAKYAGNENNDTAPFIDGNIITGARGQTYNYSIGQAVATVLENSQTRGPKTLSADHITADTASFTGEEVTWVKTYGGPGSDGGRALCETRDGDFVLTGYTYAPGQKDADILLIKTDSAGSLIWAKTFGGSGMDYGNACLVLTDGILITGYTTSFGSGMKDIIVIKTDNAGQEIWSKTYGGKSWDVGMSAYESGDGGYFILGFTHSLGAGEEDVLLIKIDSDGNEIWSKTYGGERIEMGNSVSVTKDGGCMIGAVSLTYGDKNTDFWLIRTDAQGNALWTKAYGANPKPGHGFDWCKNARLMRDGTVIATGYSDTNDLMDAVVLKTNANGEKIWLKTLGNQPFYEYGNDVYETEDGGIIMAGVTKSMRVYSKKNETVYNNDIYLVKLNAYGDTIWEKTVGGSNSDWANSIFVTKEGAIIVLGHTNSTEDGSLDVCLLKMKIE